ncbi:MAG: endonuclease III [Firmicutes bacterium]|jgi:endonuclease-3|nr:endonuclease III [Bacillota bacterium]
MEDNIKRILDLLKKHYPGARTSLHYNTPFQLLVAVILSARSTDEQVNRITPALFAAFGTPDAMAGASVPEVEELVKSCGLYRSKSRNLVKMAGMVKSRYGGNIPSTLEELISLPGVGRKTANVVLSVAFDKPAIAVDTHVFRVSKRLGLASGKTPLAVERELMEIIPRQQWSATHHRLIAHGRSICISRKPCCEECFLNCYCVRKGI